MGSIIDIRNRSNWTLGLFTTISSRQCPCIQSSLARMWGGEGLPSGAYTEHQHHKAGPGHKAGEHGEREKHRNWMC